MSRDSLPRPARSSVMARYKAEPGTRIGGVDASGEVHDELVFDDAGVLEVPDEMQEFGQTLAHAEAAGLIHREPKPKRSA